MRVWFLLLLGIVQSVSSFAQIAGMETRYRSDTLLHSGIYHYHVEAMGIGTSNDQVPLWMRANRFGSIPVDGISGSFTASAHKAYNNDEKKRLVDWAAGVEGRVNVGDRSNFQLIEGYVKGRLSIFELKAGRSRDRIGLVDPDLSSGAFVVSGNALGIPKIELSIPEYWELPLTKGLLAFKGNFVHGWMGQTPLRSGFVSVPPIQSFYHQKSLYGRLGKPGWKVKFYGGFNHQVMWGGEDKINKGRYTLSRPETFIYVVTGKAYGENGMAVSKIGNHIGSLDQAIEVSFKKVKAVAYHQFFYEVGGLYYLNNIKDGIWGLSLLNQQEQSRSYGWYKVVFEFINSKSQGGEKDAKITPSGDEDYYNNYLYAYGWSYKGENLGNPLFTNRNYARKELPSRAEEFFINNRITAFHLGLEGYVGMWDVKTLLTYSQNYGTYGSSPIGGSLGGKRNPGPPPYFQQVNQFSGYLEAGRPLKDGFRISFAIATDQGQLLYNSFGGLIKLSKSF